METIYDHNVTDEEQLYLFDSVETKEEYMSFYSHVDPLPDSLDSEYAEIYYLYMYRGDKATAKKYLNKIKNEQYRFDVQLNDIRI